MTRNLQESLLKLLKGSKIWTLQSASNIGLILASLLLKESMRQKHMDQEVLVKSLIDFLKEDCRVHSIV